MLQRVAIGLMQGNGQNNQEYSNNHASSNSTFRRASAQAINEAYDTFPIDSDDDYGLGYSGASSAHGNTYL